MFIQVRSLCLKFVHFLLAIDAQLPVVLVHDFLGSGWRRFAWDAVCVLLVVVQSLLSAQSFRAKVADELNAT